MKKQPHYEGVAAVAAASERLQTGREFAREKKVSSMFSCKN